MFFKNILAKAHVDYVVQTFSIMIHQYLQQRGKPKLSNGHHHIKPQYQFQGDLIDIYLSTAFPTSAIPVLVHSRNMALDVCMFIQGSEARKRLTLPISCIFNNCILTFSS